MLEELVDRTVRIFNIQRLCFHDGPGIRTTVFLKNCSLHCPWCSNPEGISYGIQEYLDEYQQKKYFGYDISLENLLEEVLKDEQYYGDDGGVTFSGGEPLLQIVKLEPLLKALRENGISIAFETSLFVPAEYVNIMLNYADFIFVDLKIIDAVYSKSILGGNVEDYLHNIQLIDNSGIVYKIRIPCVDELVVNDNNMSLIVSLLNNLHPKDIEIFQIHNFSNEKRKLLGIDTFPITNKEMALKKMECVLDANNIKYKILAV